MSAQENAAEQSPINKLPWRFYWSHRHPFHRIMVKTYNALASVVPFSVKYGIGKMSRKSRYPYCLTEPGSNVVQIGAPCDTLSAGRSRGMYFSLFNGAKGKTIIIEPAEQSELAFNKIKQNKKLDDMIFIRLGAWNEEKDLKLFYDPSHPATNFTEGTVDYDEKRLAEFEQVVIPCDTVDNMLKKAGVQNIDLLSMTTNGAEIEILQGMTKTLERGIKYICLARHLHIGDLKKLMAGYGYEEFAFDDRGVTYKSTKYD